MSDPDVIRFIIGLYAFWWVVAIIAAIGGLGIGAVFLAWLIGSDRHETQPHLRKWLIWPRA